MTVMNLRASGRAGMKLVSIGVLTGLMLANCLPASGAIRLKLNNTSNLNTSASWTNGLVPGVYDVARWTSIVAGANAVLLGGDMSVQGLSIFNPGGTVEIGGANALTLGQNGIEMNGASQDLVLTNAAVVIAAVEQAWRVAAGRTFTFSPAAFTRMDGATLNVQGPGTVATAVATNDPTGLLGPWATFGAGATTMYATVGGGGITGYAGTAAATAGEVVDTTGTTNYDLAAVGTLGAGASFHTLRYTGVAGTLAGDFQAHGLLNAGAGALALAGNGIIGSNLSLVLTSPDSTRALSLPGTIADNPAGASVLVKAGPGTVTLGGSNTYSGMTYVNRGTLIITNAGALGSVAGPTIVSAGPGNTAFGGQLHIRGDLALAEPLTLSGESAVNQYDSVLRSVSGTNTVLGPITSGPVGFRFGADAGSRLSVAGGLSGSNVQIVVSGAGGSTILVTNTPWHLGSSGNFYDDGAGLTILAVTGNVWGAALKAGSATLRTDVANAFPSNAALRVGVGYSTSGTVDLNGFDQTIGSLQTGTSGSGEAFSTGVRTVTSPSACTLTVDQAGASLYDGQITGEISLAKRGAGGLALSRSNSYSGLTVVHSGAIAVAHSYALGATSAITVVNAISGAFLQVSGNVDVPEALTIVGQRPVNGSSFVNTAGTNRWSGPISIVSQSRINISANSALTVAGGVNGTNTFFVLNSSGVIAFSNMPVKIGTGQFYTDSGGLTIVGVTGNVWGNTLAASGTLRLDLPDVLPTNSLLQVGVGYATGGTVDLNGNSQTIAGMQSGNTGEGVVFTTGVRTVTSAASATLTLNQSTNYLYHGRLAGLLALTKAGGGRLTLTGTNTSLGATIVSNGILALASGGSLASTSIVVGSGATLSVTGRVDGALSLAAAQVLGGSGTVLGHVNNDGTVAPGASAGLLGIAGSYAQSNGTLHIELGGTTAGTDHDVLDVTDAATLGGALTVSLVNGFEPASGDAFVILTASSITGAFATTNLPALPLGEGWVLAPQPNFIYLSVTGTPTATGFDLYAQQITNAAERGYASDPDGDGYANLLEYATGGSPTNGDQVARMDGVRTNGVLALRFTRATNALDATLIVEGSYAATDNAVWTGLATNAGGVWSGPATVSEGSGPSPVAVTVQDTDSAATNRFLRLRVTRP